MLNRTPESERMGRKSAKPVPTFREIVSLRYKKDTIMNGFATAVVLLMPLLVMSLVQLLIEMKVGRLEELEPYKNMVSQIVINIEMFVVMAILYQMHKRLRTHAQRDKMWRQSLIQFANRMGADTYELEEIDRKIRAREHFPLTPVIMLLMGLMFLFCVYLFVYYAPYWLTVEGSDEFLSNTMYIGIILCLAQLIIIFYNVLTYAYKHEKRQCEFTLELSKRLGEVGVTVPPMIRIVSHHHILTHIILLILTGGIYTIWLGFQLFKGMNRHLINQWVYENEMLRVVESNGSEKFTTYMPDYFANSRMGEKEYKKLSKRNFLEVRYTVKKLNRMPMLLIIAEFFLIALCANYILKIVALECEISTLFPLTYYPIFNGDVELVEGIRALDQKEITDVLMIPVYLIMLMLTISAMLGIASRRPTSWRKVTRSCLTFVIPLWISFVGLTNNSGLTHIFDFNVYASTILLAIVFLIMLLSRNIRDFYTPMDDEHPGILTWLRFVFFGNLDSKDKDIDVDLDNVDD